MNAQVSFNNIFATQNPVHGVTIIRDEERLMCDIDESLFEPPTHYTFIGSKNLFVILTERILVRICVVKSANDKILSGRGTNL